MHKKVILFGPLPPPYGGVSVYVNALRQHLKNRVRVWALDLSAEKTNDPNVRFVRHRRLGHIPALIGEGRGARILDTTHFHLEYPNKILLPVWLVLKLLLRFEWHKNVLDGSLPARQRRFGIVRRTLFRLAVNAVDEFVVVSEDLRVWLRDEIKVRQKITVIPCLLTIPEQTRTGALPAATEDALAAYFKHARRVCSAGVFIPSYGFHEAVDAVERLRRETREDIGLLLLDGTFARDEDYRAAVLRGRDWLTVLENVPNPDVYRILTRSDVFVRAFRDESYGISRVEAVWCGVPVVATNVGETRGMLLYDFGDADALTCQLRRALFDAPAPEVARWASVYSREAEENLQSLVSTLGLGESAKDA